MSEKAVPQSELMNGKSPPVSIGLPVYNGERYLKEVLDSILAQTFTDFELIVSDNASTDRTEQICRSYAARDRRIRYYRNQENLGAAWNCNRVFELSRGKYFKWATDDDLYAPEMLERCLDVLDRNADVVVCYPKATVIDEHGTIVNDHNNGLNVQSEAASERFAQSFRSIGLCNAVLGLTRSCVLKQTRLIGSYIGTDNRLLAELSICGKFSEVQEHLFFRRLYPDDHERREKRQDPLLELEWLDPVSKRSVVLPNWRLFWEYFLSIIRSKENLGEKMAMTAFLCRMMSWERETLREELRAAKQALDNNSTPFYLKWSVTIIDTGFAAVMLALQTIYRSFRRARRLSRRVAK